MAVSLPPLKSSGGALGSITVMEGEACTVFTIRGEVLFTDFIQLTKLYYRGNSRQRMLWDFRKANFALLEPRELEEAAEAIKIILGEHQNGRTAYLCSRDLEFGMCRLFTTHCQVRNLPIALAVFRTFREALRWLKVPAEQAYGT